MTMQGIGVVVPVFAALDHAVNPARPHIFFYDPLGAQLHAVTHAASGSGSTSIRSILSLEEQFGAPAPSRMDLPQAVRFSLRLLMVASEFDSATGGVNPANHTFATIRVLRPDGVQVVTTE